MNLVHSKDRLTALQRLITPERLSYYLEYTDNNLADAIRLYELNTKLSAIFYGPVQGVEILLRNTMNEQLCAKFGVDWHDLSAIKLANPQEIAVQRAINDIDGDITTGAVVAELPLGFWAALLNSSNDNEIWRKALYLAFPHRPKGTERKQVHGAINAIRRLRNRIAHHEKIIHRELDEDHNLILEIAGWICPETKGWIAAMSDFDPTLLPVSDEEELPLEKSESEAAPNRVEKPRKTQGGRPLLSLKKKE